MSIGQGGESIPNIHLTLITEKQHIVTYEQLGVSETSFSLNYSTSWPTLIYLFATSLLCERAPPSSL